MLHICQGNCFCESSGTSFAKAKVLYCYGEVVLQRNLPTPEEEPEQFPISLDQDMVQVIQLVVVVLFILAILIVLLTIKSGITMIEKQIKKVLLSMKGCQSWSSDEDIMESGNVNKVFLKRDTQEYKDNQETLPKNTLNKKSFE